MAPVREHSSDRVILTLACIAQFMVILDVSVVNVALPSIGRELHYNATGLQWVVNAYVLTFAGFLLLGGRAADLFGRRKVYMFGLVLFTLSSLACGFAHTSGWLTAARAVQGIGGAFLSPATLTIIVTTFREHRLAKALGVWAAMGGVGGAAGVVLGGVLTAELSWRWIFFINIPIGALTLLGAMAYLSEVRRTNTSQRLDIGGSITVTAGLAVLAYAIVGTDQYPWGSTRTLVTLGIAVVLLAAFLFIQIKVAVTPLVPLRLFRSRAVTGANVTMLLVGAAFFSMWYFVSLYIQNVLGYDALRAGMAFLPMALIIAGGAQTSSRLLPKLGPRRLLFAGTLISAAGFAWLSQLSPSGGYWTDVFGPGCMISLALGLLFTPLAAAATAGVDRAEAGLASGVLNTSRQVGGSIGLAVLATVATTYTSHLVHGGTALPSALASGYGRAFEVAAALSLLAFLAAFVVPVRRAATVPEGQTSGTVPEGQTSGTVPEGQTSGTVPEPAGSLDPV